jgi:drug/metabolite transporter (DMT)-like permease
MFREWYGSNLFPSSIVKISSSGSAPYDREISASGRGSPRPLTANVRGVLWMMAAVSALTSMFAVGKHLAATGLPVTEIAMIRMAASLMFYLPWLIRHGAAGMRTERPAGHFWRGFLGATSLFCMMYAVAHLILADAMVLGFTIPLWSILFSALFLGERMRLPRSVATVAGFAGVVLVVQPQGGIAWAALVALLGAILASGAIITMKDLTRTEPADRIVVYFFIIGTLVLVGPAIYVWRWPTPEQWGWVVLLGLFGWSGQIFMTRAYAAGEVTIIAPLDFTRVIIAGIIGFVLFNELPDIRSLVGTAVIIASCVYIVRREATLKQAEAKKPPAGRGPA